MDGTLRIFGLEGTQKFADRVCEHLGVKRNPHREEYFEDGEPYIKAASGESGNIRGCDVFVIQSLYSDATESINDKFFKVCEFIGSLKDASANRVTFVSPYLGYARQDRKTESRAPITTKYRAWMLEAVGTDRVLTMDVHNLAAEQNAFSIPFDHLEARNLFADYLFHELPTTKRIVALSPDAGGYLRTHLFRNRLQDYLKREVGIAQLDKIRINRKVKALQGTHRIIGDVRDALVISYDDLISSGGTIAKSSRAIKEHGGEVWGVCSTHGVCVGNINENLASDDIPRVIIADTVIPYRLNEKVARKVEAVDTTKLFAEAIKRIHHGTGSISDLLE